MDGIAQLALTLAVGTVASFAVFKLSVLLYERVKSPLLNPLLVTVAFIIAALVLSLIHISEPTRQAEISYAVFCLKKKKKATKTQKNRRRV